MFSFNKINMNSKINDIHIGFSNNFGMDYSGGGNLGSLGQGYVQPNLMYFGNGNITKMLFNVMKQDATLASKLNRFAKNNDFQSFGKILNESLKQLD